MSDRRHKTVAAPDDCGDVSVAGLAIVEHPAQRCYTDLEITFFDKGIGPDLGDQLRLADDLAGAFDKSDQEIESATADRHGLVIFQQQSSWPEQPERTEGDLVLG